MKFDFVAPTSLGDACALLAQHGDEAKLMGGGQSLMILLRQRLVAPRRVIGLDRLSELTGIAVAGDRLTIGAMTTYRTIYTHPVVRDRVAVLARACEVIGPLPIHNVGTIGGNVCHNAPGADPPPALLVVDARARLVSATGERTIPVADLLLGLFETSIRPDEILVSIDVPLLPADATSAYVKFAPRIIDMALVSVAAVVRTGSDGRCEEIRLAMGGGTATPCRLTSAERRLTGSRLGPDDVADAARLAARELVFLSDLHASAAYRQRVAPVLIERAVAKALSVRRGPGAQRA